MLYVCKVQFYLLFAVCVQLFSDKVKTATYHYFLPLAVAGVAVPVAMFLAVAVPDFVSEIKSVELEVPCSPPQFRYIDV